MKEGDILSLTINDICLHQEERRSQSAQCGGVYSSNYVARFMEYPNGTAVVDRIAASMHPEWERKTEKRAKILSEEMTGTQVSVRVIDIFDGKDVFEGEITL